MSLVEAATNVGVDYVLAILKQIVVFPLFGIDVGAGTHMAIVLVFLGALLIRSDPLRRLFKGIAVQHGALDNRSMTAGLTEDDDLWAAAARGTAETPTSSPRRLLPHDLDLALTHMTAGELQRLSEAVAFEMRRRKLAAVRNMPDRASGKTAEPADEKTEKSAGKTPAEGPKLTQAQINLIRSSIKVGVKPAVLQRQFGISRKQITVVLKGGAS